MRSLHSTRGRVKSGRGGCPHHFKQNTQVDLFRFDARPGTWDVPCIAWIEPSNAQGDRGGHWEHTTQSITTKQILLVKQIQLLFLEAHKTMEPRFIEQTVFGMIG